jgi:tRNA1Val (adenine37-N6)-methyltransferase
MANSYFQFKQFTIHQDRSAMKVTTDACLFGAWTAKDITTILTPQIHCLDIGTGTGLLSLMVAQQNPGCQIDAVEIDNEAAMQASENIIAADKASQVRVIHNDILHFRPAPKYDIIFSNPPFYENELKGENSRKNLAHHNEGLLLPDLFSHMRELLKDGGCFYLLLPYKRVNEIQQLLTVNQCNIIDFVVARPAIHLPPFRVLVKGGFNGNGTMQAITSEIAVKNEQDEYTPAFRALLKDYYLYL